VQRHIRDVPIAVDKLLWVIPRALLDELVRLKLFVIEICDFNATLVPAELANTSEPNPEQRETLWARVPAHIAARMSAFAASRGETVSAFIATVINKYHADRLTGPFKSVVRRLTDKVHADECRYSRYGQKLVVARLSFECVANPSVDLAVQLFCNPTSAISSLGMNSSRSFCRLYSLSAPNENRGARSRIACGGGIASFWCRTLGSQLPASANEKPD